MSNARERIPVGDRVVVTTRGKKKTYCAEFSTHGVHRRLSLKTGNRKVAVERATKLAAEIVDGRFATTKVKSIAIEEAWEEFRAVKQSEGITMGSILKYRAIKNQFFAYLKTLRVTRLDQITALHFDRYRAARSKCRSAKTVTDDAIFIRELLRWAKSRKLLAENPLAELRVSKPPLVPKTSPTLEQLLTILKAAPLLLRNQLAVLAFTGMRVGELRRLRSEDVDQIGKWVHIVSREGARTKNGKSRKVPMHQALLPIFAELISSGRPLVFGIDPPHKGGGEVRAVDTKKLNDDFKALLVELGLPAGRDNGFTLHALRRFFRTIAINSYVPQRLVDLWLGHSSDKSMDAVYYTLHDADSQRFMATLNFTVPFVEAETSSK
jgi:integrase